MYDMQCDEKLMIQLPLKIEIFACTLLDYDEVLCRTPCYAIYSHQQPNHLYGENETGTNNNNSNDRDGPR